MRQATPEDIPDVARLLAAAFADDPVMSTIWPDTHARAAALPRYFRSMLTHHHGPAGGIELACTDTTIAAAAVWDPPGRWQMPTIDLIRSAPQLALALRLQVLTAIDVRRTLDRIHPPQPHWYLCHLATDPEYQRHGIGSRLLHSGLDRCDRRGDSAYLVATTPTVVPLYQRAGFTTTRRIHLGRAESAPLDAMWRDPLR
ncbi:GNAT family N-acetyltransferase [Nocardia wallacei]|uniref:GNAT family N-acetyltransferase n=1 Tax=Nocardia wallacei TaxID=480035 RepID=UPI0024575F8D|nr:GNAT family N-acetyltransferase [Nocardia wallacei]